MFLAENDIKVEEIEVMQNEVKTLSKPIKLTAVRIDDFCKKEFFDKKKSDNMIIRDYIYSDKPRILA
ncbi:MAG: hypothetical protein PHV68_00275 [Candidatus Gastranaerophilales bacterium]|nr:hypothetical protein [Candidatus Gastranaerophilales bacterium]